MTLIVLAAVIADRRAFTMRNLAYAAFAVIIFEPEAVLGASFQLSFAAVSALVAVERGAPGKLGQEEGASASAGQPPPPGFLSRVLGRAVEALAWLFIATFCATLATASYMAYNFHELSPYVLIGNPLTLTIIEFFAVPGALIGALLYPLGLDAPVWHYVGSGHRAHLLGGSQDRRGAQFDLLPAGLRALGHPVSSRSRVLSAVIWRSLFMRLTALAFLALGLVGAVSGRGLRCRDRADRRQRGPAPHGRQARGDRRATRIPSRPSNGSGPTATAARRARSSGARDLLRQARLRGQARRRQRARARHASRPAFEEDCLRADIIVSPRRAPSTCAAPLIFDRESLASSGAVTLRIAGDGFRDDHGAFARRGPALVAPAEPDAADLGERGSENRALE